MSSDILGTSLRFQNHAPQQRVKGLKFHEQAADELGSSDLSEAGKEGLRESWEVAGGRGGYGSGYGAR